MNAAPFSQAVSWPGTTMGDSTSDEFVKFIAETFNGTRAQFIGEFHTKPDFDSRGNQIPDTGDRCDLVFAIHEEDVGKFAVLRFEYNMRWINDVIFNEKMRGEVTIYTPEFHDLCSWE